LIHYHKFLAKCIKKLRRNGVEVKQSVAPLAVFLREEVCAVSDHLVAVSTFGSDEWMACLVHFTGWIVVTDEAETAYREAVAALPLRSMQEPGDVNSPILRSQMDEHFLRTMVAQREQLRETDVPAKKPPPTQSDTSTAQPPPVRAQVPKQIHGGVRRPRYYGWWNGTAWEQTPGDNSSVQSGLSYDSYPHHPHYDYIYPIPYPPPYSYPSSENNSHSTGYNSFPTYDGWSGVAMYHGYAPAPVMEGYYPPSPAYYAQPNTPQTPIDSSSSPKSPYYWAHLDQATLAMGLATPSTPRRAIREPSGGGGPPLVRPQYQDVVSPATQFLRGKTTPLASARESPSTVETTETETTTEH
jgi:hypothetical protein